jgi:RNA polymerase sigma-B factor
VDARETGPNRGPGLAEAEREQLILEHMPLVRSLARRYANRGEPLDDLIQVGTLGLIKAVDRYDAGRGHELASFATPTILGEIRRHFRDATHTVRLPRPLQELVLQLNAAGDALAMRLGRTPTVAELAAEVGRSEEDVLDALAGDRDRRPRSLSESPLDEEDGDLEVGIDEPGFAGAEARVVLAPILDGLPPRERVILHLRLTEGLTQSEIAARVGLSQMHVSRLLAKAVTALREAAGGDPASA